MRKNALRVIAILSLTAGGVNSASAQSTWMLQEKGQAISLELLKPDYSGGDTKFSNFVGFLGFQSPLSSGKFLKLELPYSNFAPDYPYSTSEAAIGNPYIGIEFRNGEESFHSTEIGIRLPFIDKNKFGAMLNGLVTDYERIYAFAPKTATGSIAVSGYQKRENGFITYFRIAPVVTYNTDRESIDEGADRMELFFNYAWHCGFEDKAFGIGAGLTGILLVTEENASFDERSTHQADFTIFGKFDRFKPGIYLRVPLDSPRMMP